MRILISNDDGVYAPGINVLYESLASIAKVQVIAPDRDRSAASNSLTITRPIRIRELANGFLSVEGTPTDCVHLAITGLLDYKPDVVVAGINHGANLGDDILYSGTVAAAMEGRILGCPAIAISLASEQPKYFETAGFIAKKVLLSLFNKSFPLSTILNINVPDVPIDEIRGIEICRLGTRHSAEPTVKSFDPRGNPVFWFAPPGPEQDAGPGSDFYAIKENKVSMTPLKVDLTNFTAFEHLRDWLLESNLL